MPKKTNDTGVAQKSRSGTNKRKDTPGPRRERNGRPAATDPKVIANSIFALTLAPVKQVKVLVHQSGLSSGGSDLGCFFQLLHKCARRIDPSVNIEFQEKVDFNTNMNRAWGTITRIVPAGSKFNIGTDKGGLFLRIYKECDYNVNYLPCMVVGEVLLSLKAKYPALHDLFVIFLGAFAYQGGVDTWYNGMFAASQDRIAEEVSYEGPDMDNEYIDEVTAEVKYYNTGDPSLYARKAVRYKKYKISDILKRLSRLRKPHPIKNIISDGCALIQKGISMLSFCYVPEDGDFPGEFLAFDNQAAIHWQYDGHISSHYDDWIEMEYGEYGPQPPILELQVKPNGPRIDIKQFEHNCGWPARLAEFLTDAQSVLIKYHKEKKWKKY